MTCLKRPLRWVSSPCSVWPCLGAFITILTVISFGLQASSSDAVVRALSVLDRHKNPRRRLRDVLGSEELAIIAQRCLLQRVTTCRTALVKLDKGPRRVQGRWAPYTITVAVLGNRRSLTCVTYSSTAEIHSFVQLSTGRRVACARSPAFRGAPHVASCTGSSRRRWILRSSLSMSFLFAADNTGVRIGRSRHYVYLLLYISLFQIPRISSVLSGLDLHPATVVFRFIIPL